MAPLPNSPVPSTRKSPRTEAGGEVRAVGNLNQTEREALFILMARHFRGIARETFEADLDEKESVVLLFDGSRRIAGFSTLLRMEVSVDGSDVVAFFSGDTVVDAHARGHSLLPRLWSQHVFARARERPNVETVWFLISSGYKSYRFLPTFFATFVPHPDGGSPRDSRLLAALARSRFGDRFEPTTGVVRLDNPTPLHDGIADLTSHRLADPFVAFFVSANPGHVGGDELACLTRIHPDNLTDAGRRMVGPDLAAPLP